LIAVYVNLRLDNDCPNGWSLHPHWTELLDPEFDAKIYFSDECDLAQFSMLEADLKIAFYVRTDWNKGAIKEIAKLAAVCDKVFVSHSELCSPIFKKIKNVTWLIPGTASEIQKQSISWPAHFWRVTELYRSIPDQLNRLTPYANKDQMFDALLGKTTPSRHFIYKKIHKNKLNNSIICRLAGSHGSNPVSDLFDHSEFILDPEIKPIPGQPRNSINVDVEYCGRPVNVSSILPIGVYNSTRYSIIAETNADAEGIVFVTEKTAKPIIARRLFVMFSSKGTLQHLRALGFRTFGNVIDESYDLEPDHKKRWEKAFEQVQYLCTLDQQTVLDKIRDTVEHNYQLIMSNTLKTQVADSINRQIRKCLNEAKIHRLIHGVGRTSS